jgi:predicted acyl esterase
MRSLGVVLLHGLLLGSAFAQQPPPPGSSDDSGYEIHDEVLIKTHDGATLSATVVRKKGVTQPLPTLLTFDIYTDPAAFAHAARTPPTTAASASPPTRAASDSARMRSFRTSTGADTYEVIDWIASALVQRPVQCAGRYSGFA